MGCCGSRLDSGSSDGGSDILYYHHGYTKPVQEEPVNVCSVVSGKSDDKKDEKKDEAKTARPPVSLQYSEPFQTEAATISIGDQPSYSDASVYRHYEAVGTLEIEEQQSDAVRHHGNLEQFQIAEAVVGMEGQQRGLNLNFGNQEELEIVEAVEGIEAQQSYSDANLNQRYEAIQSLETGSGSSSVRSIGDSVSSPFVVAHVQQHIPIIDEINQSPSTSTSSIEPKFWKWEKEKGMMNITPLYDPPENAAFNHWVYLGFCNEPQKKIRKWTSLPNGIDHDFEPVEQNLRKFKSDVNDEASLRRILLH